MTIKYVILHDIAQLEITASHPDTQIIVLQIDAVSFLWPKKFSRLTFTDFHFLKMDGN